jgi:universal stress protein A
MKKAMTMITSTLNSHKTILCPVDFSPASEQALQYAASAHGHNSELIVLHIDRPDAGNKGTLLKEHLHQFSRYSDMLAQYGCHIRFAVEYGAPAASIIAYAIGRPTDLIVMGSHGTDRLSRLLVGSTTETVMRHSPCPVLILKSPEVTETHSSAARQGRETSITINA